MTFSLFYLLIYPIILLLSIFLGTRYAKRMQRRQKQWKPLGVEGSLVGIYALLISFSLVVSGNRARERAATIHQEADELALLFRKSKLYEEQLQGEVKDYVLEFYRIQFSKPYPTPRESSQLIDQVEALDGELDRFLVRYVAEHPERRPEVNELIQILERIGDKYFLLLYSFGENMPRPVLAILVLCSWLVGILLGFMEKMQQNKSHITLLLFMLISYIMINTIHDLDAPAKGLIKPDYSDLLDIRELTEGYYRTDGGNLTPQ